MVSRILTKSLLGLVLAGAMVSGAHAQVDRVTIGTASTGGVYYPLGGAYAAVISENLPNTEATAQVTGGSADNIKLIAADRNDIGFAMADAAYAGYQGTGEFQSEMPIRTLAVFYPSPMQVVTVEGKNIETMADLRGKRVSTGAPGSGTEIMSHRLLKAYGIDPESDIERVRLSTTESVAALKDRKIDAMMWNGAAPAPAVMSLAASPGIDIELIDSGAKVAKMREMFGPLYTKGTIPAETYPGQGEAVSVPVVWNLLVVDKRMSEEKVYNLTKALFENKGALVATHQRAKALGLASQLSGASPIPFHPGALKYFREKGLGVEEYLEEKAAEAE